MFSTLVDVFTYSFCNPLSVFFQILLADSARPLTLSNSGWSDMVIWNPYGDEGMGYDGFVCVEAAQASSSVSLGPKEYWTGAMDIIP